MFANPLIDKESMIWKEPTTKEERRESSRNKTQEESSLHRILVAVTLVVCLCWSREGH
jgi:hypothetical protein